MRISILKFNEPTPSNRVFSPENFQFSKSGQCYLNYEREHLVGLYEGMQIENDELVCEVTLHDPVLSDLWQACPDIIKFSAASQGVVELKDGKAIVTEAEFDFVSVVIKREADAR